MTGNVPPIRNVGTSMIVNDAAKRVKKSAPGIAVSCGAKSQYTPSIARKKTGTR